MLAHRPAAMRPLASAVLNRSVMRGVGALDLDPVMNRMNRGDYIDGEVIEEPVEGRGPTRGDRRRIGG